MDTLKALIDDGYTVFYTVCGEYDELRLGIKCIDVKTYEFYIPNSYEYLVNDSKLLYKNYTKVSNNKYRFYFMNKRQFIDAERLFLEKIDL